MRFVCSRRLLSLSVNLFLLLVFGCEHAQSAPKFLIGAGKADITDGADGQILQGFSDSSQRSNGILTHLYARAFVVDRYQKKKVSLPFCLSGCYNPSSNVVLIVIADMWAGTDRLKQGVLTEVAARLFASTSGKKRRFIGKISERNFMLAGTHTHAAPGGYSGFPLYEFATGGFDSHTYECMVNGIASAIMQAFQTFQPGDVLFWKKDMGNKNPGIQRSSPAYNNNADTGNYSKNVDTDILGITLRKSNGNHLAVLASHALHPVTLGQNNKKISGDTHGRVSLDLETYVNTPSIYGFANSNSGDVSPNTSPPSASQGLTNLGNIVTDYRSVLLPGGSTTTFGTANVRHQHTRVDMSSVTLDDGSGRTYEGALGLSFTAGSTEDGVARVSFDLYGLGSININAQLLPEGVTTSNEGNYATQSAAVRAAFDNVFDAPSYGSTFRNGHSPKPILIATGKTDPPVTPNVVPLQLFRINDLAIVGFPGEPTTMAGRRLRDTIKQKLGVQDVMIISFANEYSGYTTTKEEYNKQHYEGAQTLFGPNTLAAYQQEFGKLAQAIADGTTVGTGPSADEESVRNVARVTIRNLCSSDKTVKFYRKKDFVYLIPYDTVTVKAGRDEVWYIPQDLLGSSDKDFQAKSGGDKTQDIDPGDMVRLCPDNQKNIRSGSYVPWNEHY